MRGRDTAPRLDVAAEQLIEAVGAGASALLASLRATIAPGEQLVLVAKACSPEPGVVALTSTRLMFLFTVGRGRGKAMISTFARGDLRGCRRLADDGLVLLRFAQPTIQFSEIQPTNVRDALIDQLGDPPADQWLTGAPDVSVGMVSG